MVKSILHGRCVQPQLLKSGCREPGCRAYGQQVDKGKDQSLTGGGDVVKGADSLPWLSHQRRFKVLFTVCPQTLHPSVLAWGEATCQVTQHLPKDTFSPGLSACDYLLIRYQKSIAFGSCDTNLNTFTFTTCLYQH